MITNIFNNKKGKLQKLLILILLTTLLSLVLIGINSAENVTETYDDLTESASTNNSLEDATLETSNITNQTPSEPAETTSQSSGSASEPGAEEIEIPELNIKISHANQMTRGTSTELTAIIENIGGIEAKNIFIVWNFPSEFKIISGSQEEELGNISPGDSINSNIELQTSYFTSLGINEIKLRASYENV